MARRSDPTSLVEKHVSRLKKDVFALIWIVFAVALLIMSVYFKEYVKDMIVISIMFILIRYLEPILYNMHGNSVTTFLSRGAHVPKWKRFPLFFLEIIFLYIVFQGLQLLIEYAFPTTSINIIVVIFWLGFLFFLWYYALSKEE